MSVVADLGAYLLMALSVAAISTAGFLLCTPAGGGPAPTWRSWALLAVGAGAACAAAVLT